MFTNLLFTLAPPRRSLETEDGSWTSLEERSVRRASKSCQQRLDGETNEKQQKFLKGVTRNKVQGNKPRIAVAHSNKLDGGEEYSEEQTDWTTRMYTQQHCTPSNDLFVDRTDAHTSSLRYRRRRHSTHAQAPPHVREREQWKRAFCQGGSSAPLAVSPPLVGGA